MTRILYIEDEPNNRMLVRRLFMMLAPDWEYAEAENGAQGIQRAQELKPDMILMDISMPDMDGLTATGRIRQLPDIQKTPIIALTANAMEGDRERFLAAGCDGYISKPIDIDTFIDTVRDYLEKSRQARLKAVAQTAPLRLAEKPPTVISRPAGLAEAAAKAAVVASQPPPAPPAAASAPVPPASAPVAPAPAAPPAAASAPVPPPSAPVAPAPAAPPAAASAPVPPPSAPAASAPAPAAPPAAASAPVPPASAPAPAAPPAAASAPVPPASAPAASAPAPAAPPTTGETAPAHQNDIPSNPESAQQKITTQGGGQ